LTAPEQRERAVSETGAGRVEHCGVDERQEVLLLEAGRSVVLAAIPLVAEAVERGVHEVVLS